MPESILRKGQEFPFGQTVLCLREGPHGEMLMDCKVLRLRKGDVYDNASNLERAYLLVSGTVRFEWENQTHEVSRANCFDVGPTALHLPGEVPVTITGLGDDSELIILGTDNDKVFPAKLYGPEDTPDEKRGAGLMRETSTRIVRTIFDHSNAPDANLVLGEVIGFPGKWSSYPPHHHPQPEIYYYKLNPSHGFAYGEAGDEVYKLHHNDCLFLTEGMTHPHVTAPGYALWYLWAIRHLPDNPYITPTFLPEHLWVLEEDAPIWPSEEA